MLNYLKNLSYHGGMMINYYIPTDEYADEHAETHAVIVGNGPSIKIIDWHGTVNPQTHIIATNRTWQGVPADYIIFTDEKLYQNIQDRPKLVQQARYIPSEHGSGYNAGLWALNHFDRVWLVGFDGARMGRDESIHCDIDSTSRAFHSEHRLTKIARRKYGIELEDLIRTDIRRVVLVETQDQYRRLEKATGLKRMF